MYPAATPDTACETHALPMDSPHSVTMPVLTDFAIFAPLHEFHARQLNPLHWSHLRMNLTIIEVQYSQKCKKTVPQKPLVFNHLQILLKVNKGKRVQKNSEFFSGHFYGKSLANPQKMAEKTVQIHAKNTRILTCFCQRQFVNLSPTTWINSCSISAYPRSSTPSPLLSFSFCLITSLPLLHHRHFPGIKLVAPLVEVEVLIAGLNLTALEIHVVRAEGVPGRRERLRMIAVGGHAPLLQPPKIKIADFPSLLRRERFRVMRHPHGHIRVTGTQP